MTTIVHGADLHLETTFPGVRGGAKRRATLGEALVRLVDCAIERRADVLTLGGDLYEARRAGPQTARFLFEQLARFPGPVFIAPGNHDPYSAGSLYARDDRPANVRIFDETAWRAFPLADGVTLYGFGHTPAEPGRPFAGTKFDRAGFKIALVHGSDEERCPPGKRATAPFTLGEIAASGAALALSGHYHGGYVEREDGTTLAYPGSPEPIIFGERGAHGALIVTIEGEEARVEPFPLARTRLLDRDCPLADATSEAAVIAAIEAALDGCSVSDYVRVHLHGTVAPATRVDVAMLGERFESGLGALEIVDETIAADYDAIAAEPTVRGHVVRDLLARARDGDVLAPAALRATIAAFDGAPIAPEHAR